MKKEKNNIVGKEKNEKNNIVGKGVIPLPPSKILFLSRNLRCPHLYRPIRETKVLNVLTNLYIISTHKVTEFWNNIYTSGEMKT